MTGLQRHKPMARSKLLARTALSRGKPLARKTRVKPRNDKRKAEQFARNYGDEAEAVRAMPCLCRGVGPLVRCAGEVVAAHVVSRGASGGRFDLIPLCQHHHDEQHACGVATFAERYGLDLRLEADRIALGHSEPLGIRGIAERWAWWGSTRCGLAPGEPLNSYELDALLGWVRRRGERVEHDVGATEHRRRWNMTEAVSRDLGVPEQGSCECAGPGDDDWLDEDGCCPSCGVDRFHDEDGNPSGPAWALCEAAGWP
jgi:hypothetical protein